MALVQLKCERPVAGTKPISADQARLMAAEIPGWTVGDSQLEREFKLDGFRGAIDFVNALADLVEQQDHHPDILISYDKVHLTLSTHKIGGLSRNDFILAAKINELVAARGQQDDPHMDRIVISDLRARCIIGLNPEERRDKQDVVVNLVIFADLRQAGRSDRFEDTVDYRKIKKAVLQRIEESQFLLLEALAQTIADTCLDDPRVQRVRVRVDKPSALRFARSVAVQITRSRDEQP